MNQDVAEKWTTALRSGDFVQGKFVLRNPANEYCCLGVLCELYRQEFGGEWVLATDTNTGRMYDSPTEEERHTYFFVTEDKGNNQSQTLPKPVMEWVGLSDPNGTFNFQSPILENFITDALTDRNDAGSTFEDIAQIIEEGDFDVE